MFVIVGRIMYFESSSLITYVGSTFSDWNIFKIFKIRKRKWFFDRNNTCSLLLPFCTSYRVNRTWLDIKCESIINYLYILCLIKVSLFMVDFQTDKYFVFTLSFNVKDIVVFSFKSIASTIQLKSLSFDGETKVT